MITLYNLSIIIAIIPMIILISFLTNNVIQSSYKLNDDGRASFQIGYGGYDANEVVVVGNIFQNKELIN